MILINFLNLLMHTTLKFSFCNAFLERTLEFKVTNKVMALKLHLIVYNLMEQVAPMGLFYPTLLVPDVYPPPPRSWWVLTLTFCVFCNKITF